jgi:TonB family protein
MKIAGTIAVALILAGVLGYFFQHKSASTTPSLAPDPTPTPSLAPVPSPSPALPSGTPAANEPASTLKRLRISSGVANELAIYNPAPQYPQMARIAHISGDVVLGITIDRKGEVTNIVVHQGHPILVNSAIDAVKKWKYRPYVLNGEAVEVDSTIKIQYHM